MWASVPVDILANVVPYFPNDDHVDALQSIWSMAAVNVHWRQSVLKVYCVFSTSVPLHCTPSAAVRKFLNGLTRFRSLYTLYLRQRCPLYDEKLYGQCPKRGSCTGFQDRGINWCRGEKVLGDMRSLRRMLVEEDCLRRNDLEFIGDAAGLRQLEMDPCPYLRDYSPIARLSCLTHLNVEFSIHQVPEVAGFCMAVSSLRNLRILQMSRFPRLRSQYFNGFGNLCQLESLGLIECSFNVRRHPEAWLSSMRSCHCLSSVTIKHGETADKLVHNPQNGLWSTDTTFSLIQSLNLPSIKSVRTLTIPYSVHRTRDMKNLSQMVNLSALEMEYLPDQELDGILSVVKHIKGLKVLKLESCGRVRNSESFKSLFSLPNLHLLDLTRCGINDECLVHIGRQRQLVELVLTENSIQGPGVAHLVWLRRLQTLNLAMCKGGTEHKTFDGSFLKSLTKLRSLRNLVVGGTLYANSRGDIDDVVNSLTFRGICVKHLTSSYRNPRSEDWNEWNDWGAGGWVDWGDDDWGNPVLPYHPHNMWQQQDHHWSWDGFPDWTWDLGSEEDYEDYEDLEDESMQKICRRKLSLQQTLESATRGNRCFEKRIHNWRRSHGNKYYQDRFSRQPRMSSSW